jgi:hypothetical protein
MKKASKKMQQAGRTRSTEQGKTPSGSDPYHRLAEELGRLIGRYLAEEVLREKPGTQGRQPEK